jgi:hypothetical protein
LTDQELVEKALQLRSVATASDAAEALTRLSEASEHSTWDLLVNLQELLAPHVRVAEGG